MRFVKVLAERKSPTESGKKLYDPVFVNADLVLYVSPAENIEDSFISFNAGSGLIVQGTAERIIAQLKTGGN